MFSLFSSPRVEDSPYAIFYLIAAVQMLLLGAVVVIRDFKNRSYVSFFLVSFTCVVWLTCQYFYKLFPFSPEGEGLAIQITKIEYLAVPFISISFSFFIFSFLHLVEKYKYFLLSGCAIASAFAFVSLSTNFFIDGVYVYRFAAFDTFYPKYTLLGIPFLLYFVFYAFFTFAILISHYRKSGTGLRKNQMKVFIIAYCTAYTAMVDFLPCLGIKVFPIGVISIYLYVLLMTRALFKEKIFDIRNDFLIFFANVILTALLFTGMLFTLQNKNIYRFFIAQPPVVIALTLLVFFFGIHRIHGFFKPRLQAFISKKINDINVHLAHFSGEIKKRHDPDGIITTVTTAVISALNLESCTIYLQNTTAFYSKGKCFRADEAIVTRCALLQKERIKELHEFKDIPYLQKYRHIRNELAALMKELGTKCGVPIFHEDEFLALIILGKKRDNSDLSESEITFLKNVQNEFGMHLRAALLEKENLQRREQLSHAEKLAALGTVVAGVAHEINNPNNSIMLDAQTQRKALHTIFSVLDERADNDGDFGVGGLDYGELKQELEQSSDRIIRNSQRINRIVTDLRSFSRKDIPMNETVTINEVVSSAISVIEHTIKKCTHFFSVACDANTPAVTGNTQSLEQVFINIIKNACQALASSDKGIFVATSFDAKANEVSISVRDEGRGMDAETLMHIFTPFYTTKNAEGTGLGLSICDNIVKRHNGRIEIDSKPVVGTTIRVILPAAPPPIPDAA